MPALVFPYWTLSPLLYNLVVRKVMERRSSVFSQCLFRQKLTKGGFLRGVIRGFSLLTGTSFCQVSQKRRMLIYLNESMSTVEKVNQKTCYLVELEKKYKTFPVSRRWHFGSNSGKLSWTQISGRRKTLLWIYAFDLHSIKSWCNQGPVPLNSLSI